MSSAYAQVRFQDGTIFNAQYNGYQVCNPLYTRIEDLDERWGDVSYIIR